MNNSIDDIREKLSRFTPENMQTTLHLLHRLLNRHYQATVSVDIERAVLMTQHLKQTEGSGTFYDNQKSGGCQEIPVRKKNLFSR